MVAVEYRPRLDSGDGTREGAVLQESFPGQRQPDSSSISAHTKRMMEIKIDRWKWYKSMGERNRAEAELADIHQYALQHAPRRR